MTGLPPHFLICMLQVANSLKADPVFTLVDVISKIGTLQFKALLKGLQSFGDFPFASRLLTCRSHGGASPCNESWDISSWAFEIFRRTYALILWDDISECVLSTFWWYLEGRIWHLQICLSKEVPETSSTLRLYLILFGQRTPMTHGGPRSSLLLQEYSTHI